MPKLKNPAAYLSDHDTPEVAIEQAIADAMSQSAGARRFKRAYGPMVEALGLPGAIEDNDSAIDAARDAARDALLELSEGDGEAGDAAADLLAEIAERLGLSLDALSELSDDATDEQVDAAIDAVLAPVQEWQGKAQEADKLNAELVYSRAAGSEFDPDKLRKIAPNLTARTVKGEDGEVTEYGIAGDGDAWTPLADAVKGWEPALKRGEATAPTPAPKPLPTGGAGSKAQPKTSEQIAAEKRARPEYSGI